MKEKSQNDYQSQQSEIARIYKDSIMIISNIGFDGILNKNQLRVVHTYFINYYLNTLLHQFLQYLQQCAMSLFHTITNFNTFLNNAKQTLNNLTNFNPFPTTTKEIKPEKGSINDTTMASQVKIDEDQHVDIQQKVYPSQDITYKPKWEFQQKGPKLFSLTCQKRHQKVSYFTPEGKELSCQQGRQFQQDQHEQSRKRTRCIDGETFEHEYCRLLRKYVKNDWLPTQREENYAEMRCEMGRFTIKGAEQEKYREGVTKVTFRQINQKQNLAKRPTYLHPTDLPDSGNYTINYSLESLSQMTFQQLSAVPKLTISASQGRIHFLEPVSLFRKDIDACLRISYGSIQIVDCEWRCKKMRLAVYQSVIPNSEQLQRVMKSASAIGLTKMIYSERDDSYIFSASSKN